MDAKTLIEAEAVKFIKWGDFVDPVAFKDKLETAIYPYYENIDKLYFLYKVLEILTHEKDTHKCKEPQPCRTVRELQHQILFAEQEVKHINPSYVYTVVRPNLISTLIKQNLVDLRKYGNAAKTYQSAMDKLNEGKYERNLLDDFRHCLEDLLRHKLNNKAPLEKQTEPLGTYLKSIGVDPDLRQLITTQMTYYTKYQDENIKHPGDLKESEIEFLTNISLTLIRYIATI